MKPLDQCPSTVGKASEKRERAGSVSGRSYWRSVEEYADSDGFREFLEREFPAGASELLTSSRRSFMKLMGASMALAGAATIPGCRRPDHKIMPYSADVPEDVIPGKPIYYATAMPLPGGGAEGLIVETHENRPTKIEGNPLHSVNQGRSSVLAQASILGLYDTDRLTDPKTTIGGEPGKPRSWDEFEQWQATHFAKFDNDGGASLAFIVDKKTSPSRDAARAMVMSRWPKATWIAYDAAGSDSEAQGAGIAFGQPMRAVHDFSKAKCVLALNSDFLCQGAGSVVNARVFAAGRRVAKAHDEMSRLYSVETTFSNTGSVADHRLALSPSEVAAYVVTLAKKIVATLASQGEENLGQLAEALLGLATPVSDLYDGAHWIDAVAADLIAHRGNGLVIAGPSLSAEIHALVIALNAGLGNLGKAVRYVPMSAEEALSSPDRLASLAGRMRSGQIDTIVAIEVNPVFDAPVDLEFGALYAKVPTTVCMSSSRSESSAASTWALPGTHYLEAWGDAEAYDGSVTVIQPMIAPLYNGKSEIELLALLADEEYAGGQEIVREVWTKALGAGGFEKKWKRALHDGVIRPALASTVPALLNAAVASAVSGIALVSSKAAGTFEVLFMPSHLYDGRFANNGWLQELPHAATRVAWDNPALISPATAERLGIMPDSYTQKMPKARMIRLEVGGHAMRLPVWIMPGMPDDTVIVQFGYGRTNCGRVGGDASEGIDWQVGFNTFAIKPTGVGLAARGAKMSKVPGEYLIASTQNHWSMESRTSILRQMDKKWWDVHAAEFEKLPGGREDHRDTGYGTSSQLNLAEQLGESGHGPPNLSIYKNPRNESFGEPTPEARYSQGQQWGMTIDLSTCTGCGTCTIACQAENNIPIVGKKETAKGREMQWIRVDRYYFDNADGTGNDWKNPGGMAYQPVACVHCENAPCETVCPVNATSHGPEGMNYMVYNRCIGTRYCANNCPYKVRRFNFFDYGVKTFNGDYIGQGLTKRPDNVNFIPPRLREKLAEIEKLQKNPDVTVRSRGVMEKCSYCVQRVNEARIEAKIRGIKKPGTNEVMIPDGFFQVACQQACPSEAITFGDLRDETSAVYEAREGQRSYLLLGYLATRPRTSHMLRIDNPNEAMISQARIDHDPLGHKGGDGEQEAAPEGEHAFFDKTKTSEDAGYALSLRVLGPSTGIHA